MNRGLNYTDSSPSLSRDLRRNSFDGLIQSQNSSTPTSAIRKSKSDNTISEFMPQTRFRRSEGGLANRPQLEKREPAFGFKDFIEIMAKEEAKTVSTDDETAMLKEYSRRHMAKVVAL